MKLPVTVRRFFGLHVNGPRPGFKRTKTIAPSINKPVRNIQLDCTLPDLNNLAKGNGILIPAQYWKTEYHNFNAAQAGIRDKHPKRQFSIRTACNRGGTKDMLVIRVA